MPPIDKTMGIIESPYNGWFVVTPDDFNDLPILPRALYIGASGAVAMKSLDGSYAIFLAMPIGVYELRAARIFASGTTSTSIIALY